MLPSPTGPFQVGATTLIHKVELKSFGSALLPDGTHALAMDSVVATVFYPADLRDANISKGVHWLPRPLSAAVAGLSKLSKLPRWLVWPVVALYAARIRIPAYKEAPMLAPIEPGNRWPLILFSHGLCGAKTFYSQICASMASQGNVVVAIEHRDRSGVVVNGYGEHPMPKVYLTGDDIKWESGEAASKFAFRIEGLAFRQEEIYQIYDLVAAIVAGNDVKVMNEDGVRHDLSTWRGHTECTSDVVLAGHSFGACTTLSILSSPPPGNRQRIPFSRVLLFDPWADPLSSPGPMPTEWNPIPVCIINSEVFTLWESHFAVVEELARKWPAKASLLTLGLLYLEIFAVHLTFIHSGKQTCDILGRVPPVLFHGGGERTNPRQDHRSGPWISSRRP